MGFLSLKQPHNSAAMSASPQRQVSGSSVRGRARTNKVWNKNLRNLLFSCSFNAYKYNKTYRELYERIVAKGKSKKLAIIAVANKLLEHSFAIAKTGLIYDAIYQCTLVRN
jgi:transposase